jgi:hypothetical protein
MRREVGDDRIRTFPLVRRALLASAVSTVGTTIAGCSALGGSNTPEEPFGTLDREAVFVDDAVDLSVPESVSTADDPAAAGLVVFPGDTDRSPTLSAEWLAAGSSVALLGDGCSETWNSWVTTGAFATNFDVMGAEWGQPGADLVVGAAVGLNLVTYGRTWEEPPSDREVLHELDGIAADVADRTGGD